MAVIQENRLDAPRPEVEETDYGAQYVKAATETPVVEPVKEETPEEESIEQTAEETPSEAVEVKRPVKKGRPRKKSK